MTRRDFNTRKINCHYLRVIDSNRFHHNDRTERGFSTRNHFLLRIIYKVVEKVESLRGGGSVRDGLKRYIFTWFFWHAAARGVTLRQYCFRPSGPRISRVIKFRIRPSWCPLSCNPIAVVVGAQQRCWECNVDLERSARAAYVGPYIKRDVVVSLIFRYSLLTSNFIKLNNYWLLSTRLTRGVGLTSKRPRIFDGSVFFPPPSRPSDK